jgi:hypothetical protein
MAAAPAGAAAGGGTAGGGGGLGRNVVMRLINRIKSI